MINILDILNNNHGKKILVVGDIVLDKYVYGQCHRLSSEYPIPVFSEEKIEYRLGGSGNVAKNLREFNLEVDVLSIISDQEVDKIILRLLKELNIGTNHLKMSQAYVTSVKTRYVSDKYQLFRSDISKSSEQVISQETIKDLKNIINHKLGEYSCIMISDYNNGFLTDELTQLIIKSGQKHQVPVVIDPKRGNYLKFKGAYMIKPNRKDAEHFCGFTINDNDSLTKACQFFHNKLGVQHCILTLSDEGMAYLASAGNLIKVDVPNKMEVIDVSGAGDTVSATICLGLVNQLDVHDICLLANVCASTVIGKIGVVPVCVLSLIRKFNHVVRSADELETLTIFLKKSRKRVVFTTGCFDIIHGGHVESLRQAKECGEILILALNSDKSISSIKGPERPICELSSRIKILEAIEYIDYIIVFDEPTPVKIAEILDPDIIVKGGDYQEDQIREIFPMMKEFKSIPLVPGLSTTNVVEKIKQMLQDNN